MKLKVIQLSHNNDGLRTCTWQGTTDQLTTEVFVVDSLHLVPHLDGIQFRIKTLKCRSPQMDDYRCAVSFILKFHY